MQKIRAFYLAIWAGFHPVPLLEVQPKMATYSNCCYPYLVGVCKKSGHSIKPFGQDSKLASPATWVKNSNWDG